MKLLPARPTVYKGIRMRSRLEATVAQELDADGLQWQYEPLCFADETGQYLPDFLVWVDAGEPAYVEVKPDLGNRPMRVMEQMAIIHSSDPDIDLIVTCGVRFRWYFSPQVGRWMDLDFGHDELAVLVKERGPDGACRI